MLRVRSQRKDWLRLRVKWEELYFDNFPFLFAFTASRQEQSIVAAASSYFVIPPWLILVLAFVLPWYWTCSPESHRYSFQRQIHGPTGASVCSLSWSCSTPVLTPHSWSFLFPGFCDSTLSWVWSRLAGHFLALFIDSSTSPVTLDAKKKLENLKSRPQFFFASCIFFCFLTCEVSSATSKRRPANST